MIDWFTLVASIINFLILLWLLKHFFYGPVMKAMRERQQRISGQMSEAEQREAEAQEEAEKYRRQRRALDEEKEKILSEARDQAEQERRKRMEKAREEVEQARQEWLEALREDRRSFEESLRLHAGRQVVAVARAALTDLADQELEQQVGQTFLGKLDSLDKKELEEFKEAAKESDTVRVCSGFELNNQLKGRIRKQLESMLGEIDTLNYDLEDELIAGIEVRVASYRLGWTFNHYLKSLEERIERMLREKTHERQTEENGKKKRRGNSAESTEAEAESDQPPQPREDLRKQVAQLGEKLEQLEQDREEKE